MIHRRRVRITKNFDQNLADIRQFLEEQQVHREFGSLIETLFATVIPNLERFPVMGVDFFVKAPQSAEGPVRLETLRQRLGKNTG